ncbi:ATPase, T2SS/T4P/T4SS family [Escherichia coli]
MNRARRISAVNVEKSLVIRFRVDGTVRECWPGAQTGLAAGIAYQGDGTGWISPKRRKDGRIALLLGGGRCSVRVSTMPSAWGERVVLRLLDKRGPPDAGASGA